MITFSRFFKSKFKFLPFSRVFYYIFKPKCKFVCFLVKFWWFLSHKIIIFRFLSIFFTFFKLERYPGYKAIPLITLSCFCPLESVITKFYCIQSALIKVILEFMVIYWISGWVHNFEHNTDWIMNNYNTGNSFIHNYVFQICKVYDRL